MHLNLTSLEVKRERGDLYKIENGINKVNWVNKYEREQLLEEE